MKWSRKLNAEVAAHLGRNSVLLNEASGLLQNGRAGGASAASVLHVAAVAHHCNRAIADSRSRMEGHRCSSASAQTSVLFGRGRL